MARPIKQGLDYFPLDTNMDDNFELIEAKYGLEGFGVLIKLYQRAYKECGYYYPWTEKEQLLFSKRVNVSNNTVNNIIIDAVTYGIFDKRLYDLGILTSHGMQKRYIEATIRRREITMYLDLLLINVDDIPVNVGKNPRKITLIEYSNTQKKGNEMKLNERESKAVTALPSSPKKEIKKHSEEFDVFWSLYPKKVSKGQAEKTYGAMMKRGVEADSILSCLQNYLDEIRKTGKEYQFIKNPSTFLNNYLDYENPVPVADRGGPLRVHTQTAMLDLEE